MTEREWIRQAEDYESKSQEAYDRGDIITGELWALKAEACRHNACYGTVETDK